MTAALPEYDPRYLAGILCFNERDFFEAHEVWESLWLDTAGGDKQFYQGLIQAAVALYHFGNGNVRGAAKLYRTGRAYMERYGSPHLGLDSARFWQQMHACFTELLAIENPDRHTVKLNEDLIPTLALEPEPESWPNVADYVEAEE